MRSQPRGPRAGHATNRAPSHENHPPPIPAWGTNTGTDRLLRGLLASERRWSATSRLPHTHRTHFTQRRRVRQPHFTITDLTTTSEPTPWTRPENTVCSPTAGGFRSSLVQGNQGELHTQPPEQRARIPHKVLVTFGRRKLTVTVQRGTQQNKARTCSPSRSTLSNGTEAGKVGLTPFQLCLTPSSPLPKASHPATEN